MPQWPVITGIFENVIEQAACGGKTAHARNGQQAQMIRAMMRANRANGRLCHKKIAQGPKFDDQDSRHARDAKRGTVAFKAMAAKISQASQVLRHKG